MKKFSQKQAGILNSSDLKTAKGKMIYWTFFAILVIASLIAVIPSLWMIATAFKDTKEIYAQPNTFFPADMSLSTLWGRITEAWTELKFGKSIINTLIMSIGEWAFGLSFCALGGYSISKLRPTGSRLVFSIILWIMLMPGSVRTVPLYMTFVEFPIGGISFMNTYWPMFLMAAADCFNIMLFKNTFDGISDSYIEAAELDGAGFMYILIKIVIPLSMPVLIYASIGLLSVAWGDFFFPYLLLTDNSIQTLPVKTYMMKQATSFKMNTYMMGLIIASVPLFLIFVLFQRNIVGGINVGGVKG